MDNFFFRKKIECWKKLKQNLINMWGWLTNVGPCWNAQIAYILLWPYKVQKNIFLHRSFFHFLCFFIIFLRKSIFEKIIIVITRFHRIVKCYIIDGWSAFLFHPAIWIFKIKLFLKFSILNTSLRKTPR